MRLLITGVSGFAGQHLAKHLLQQYPSAEIFGTVFRSVTHHLPEKIQCHQVDLCDETAVLSLISAIRPDVIYHLAGQASAARSFENPRQTLKTNIFAGFNLLEACTEVGIRPRIISVSSADIYGIVPSEKLPITEDMPLHPASPYSLSKATQDLMGLQYYHSHQLPVIRARAFNHIGPGQRDRFVAPSFALQIARIEAGLQEAVISVGNLEAQRDFTDVRDVVRAYVNLAEKGQPGTAYNIASNHVYTIQHLLDTLLSLTTTTIDVRIDTARLRPSDMPIIQGDYTRLHQATGWQPSIDFTQTLHDILEDCRERIEITLRS
ncbi:MAG: GDP-mannose 4,6-dehydratase [Aggregatilineales bacterium]